MDTNWGEEIERDLQLVIDVMDSTHQLLLHTPGERETESEDATCQVMPTPAGPSAYSASTEQQPLASAPTDLPQPTPAPTDLPPPTPAPEHSQPTVPAVESAAVIPAATPIEAAAAGPASPVIIMKRSKSQCDPRATDDPRLACAACAALRNKVDAHEQSIRRLRHEVTQCNDVVQRFELILAQTVQRVDGDMARIDSAHRGWTTRWNEFRDFRQQQPPSTSSPSSSSSYAAGMPQRGGGFGRQQHYSTQADGRQQHYSTQADGRQQHHSTQADGRQQHPSTQADGRQQHLSIQADGKPLLWPQQQRQGSNYHNNNSHPSINNHWKQHGPGGPPPPLSSGMPNTEWEWDKFEARGKPGGGFNRERPPSARNAKERRGAPSFSAEADLL